MRLSPLALAVLPALASLTTNAAEPAKNSGFNPEVSLILQGAYKQMKDIPERSISGFWPAGHDHAGEEASDPRGFTLDHSELSLAANIDNLFRGHTTLAFADEEVEIEEAWFQTLSLGHGFTVRGGRYLSGIGYQNERHAHDWDFADNALMYTALFGEHGYSHDGLQLKWVAPAPFFLEFGAEVGRGAKFPGTDRNTNGAGARSLFAHTGGDIGRSHAWRAGLSWLGTRALEREGHFEDTDGAGPNEVEGLFSGRSRTMIADFVWKWAPEGKSTSRNFKFQAEYFRRKESGTLACESDVGTSPCNAAPSGAYESRQSGWYLQGAYQFTQGWRVGYRYDQLSSGSVSATLLDDGTLDGGSAPLVKYRPKRHSVMVDWSPSEFSRLRLQFAQDKSMQGVKDNQWTLQYVVSLGSHGAHKF